MITIILDKGQAQGSELLNEEFFILLCLETGKCMYSSLDFSLEEELEAWNRGEETWRSIYALCRETRKGSFDIILDCRLGDFETIEEARKFIKMHQLLE